MRKHRAITATLALAGAIAAVLLVLVPMTALAGNSNLPKITSYVNDKGNSIKSANWDKGPIYINGDKLNQLNSWQCSSGKNSWSPMYVDNTYSSKQATAYLNPDCSGHTGPIRAWFDETGPWIIGPDLTVTGAFV
jgi:hypothetical protein